MILNALWPVMVVLWRLFAKVLRYVRHVVIYIVCKQCVLYRMYL